MLLGLSVIRIILWNTSEGCSEPGMSSLLPPYMYMTIYTQSWLVQIPWYESQKKHNKSNQLYWTCGVSTSIWPLLILMWQNDACLTIRVHVVAWHLWRGKTLLKRVCAITALIHCYNLLLWWCQWRVRCHHPFHSVGHHFCKANRRAQSLLRNKEAAARSIGCNAEPERRVSTASCVLSFGGAFQIVSESTILSSKLKDLQFLTIISGAPGG